MKENSAIRNMNENRYLSMLHLDVLNDQVIGVETLVLGVALGVLRGIENVIKSLQIVH